MAKFQPRYRDLNDRAPVEGEFLFTGEGEMYGNPNGSAPIPLHSVHVVADLSALNSLSPAYRSIKRLYRVGNALYRWNGTSIGTISDWTLLNSGNEAVLVELEFDPADNSFDIQANVLNSRGKPTGEMLDVDGVVYPFLENIVDNKSSWQRLNELSHEQSLEWAVSQPIERTLTFWEYRKLCPNGLPREEFGALRNWQFEYNGTAWQPVPQTIVTQLCDFAKYQKYFPDSGLTSLTFIRYQIHNSSGTLQDFYWRGVELTLNLYSEPAVEVREVTLYPQPDPNNPSRIQNWTITP